MKKKTTKDEKKEKPLSEKGKLEVKKKIFIFSAIFLLTMTFLWVGYFSVKLTGQSILSVDTFVDETGVSGDIKITLKNGELIPENSQLTIYNENNTFEFSLSDLITESTTSGTYYVSGSDLEGEGEGYGAPGERVVSPTVYFEIKLSIDEENETIEEIIEGEASSDSTYEYDITGDFSAEIVEGSVRTDDEDLGENVLDLDISSDKITVTTDYTLTETGFSEEYLTDESTDFLIPIDKLGVELMGGSFEIYVTYNENEIVAFSDFIESLEEPIPEEETTTPTEEENVSNATIEEPVEEPTTEPTVEEPTQEPGVPDEPTIPEAPLIPQEPEIPEESIETFKIANTASPLSESEKQLLRDNLGLIAISTDVKKKGNKIIVDFNTNGYSMMKTYDIVNNEELDILLEKDSILWLRDLANHFSITEETESAIEGYSFSYSEI